MMINKNFAQYVKEEDRLRVELSSSFESDKNALIKDDNNNNQEEDKNKESSDVSNAETNGQLTGQPDGTEAIRSDKKAIKSNENGQGKEADRPANDKAKDEPPMKSADEPMNGRLESDSKQTSIETDYSNE